MSSAVRVRRLAVQAPDRETGGALRTRLEDALRVASLPGGNEGRLVFIWRLRLRGVRRDAGAQSLAAQIERAAATEGGTPVHGEATHAAAADAVWFADRCEAEAALFVRLVRGERADAWYWPLVFPELHLHSKAEGLRRLAVAALRPKSSTDRGWALRSAAAFALEVARRGAAAELAAVCPANEAEVLMGEYGWSADAVPNSDEAARVSFDPHAVAELAGCEESQAAPALVLSVLACAADPALVECRSLPALARRALSHARADRRGPRLLRDGDSASRGTPDLPRALAAMRAAEVEAAEPPPLPHSAAESVRHSSQATQAAGLLLLLPMLARLGVRLGAPVTPDPEEVDAGTGGSAAQAVDVRSVLSCCLEWLRVPAGDAAWLLADRDEPVAGQTEAAEAAKFWLRRLRIWSAGEMRMQLRRLVLRRGRISVSLTHADVELPLASIDIRIRRTGLDVDPGWVAAYGRVVRFHYR